MKESLSTLGILINVAKVSLCDYVIQPSHLLTTLLQRIKGLAGLCTLLQFSLVASPREPGSSLAPVFTYPQEGVIEASTLLSVPIEYVKLYHLPFGYSSATSLFVNP